MTKAGNSTSSRTRKVSQFEKVCETVMHDDNVLAEEEVSHPSIVILFFIVWNASSHFPSHTNGVPSLVKSRKGFTINAIDAVVGNIGMFTGAEGERIAFQLSVGF